MCITSCRHINIRGANLVIIVASMLGMILFEECGAKEQARREAKRDRERREFRFAKLDERRPKPRCVCRCVASVGVLKLECEGSELNAFPATVAKDIPALNCGCGVRCITRG